MEKEINLVTVYVASSQPEAHIIKGRLEDEGIPAVLKYESLGVVYGITVDGLGRVEVQVPENMADSAAKIISAGSGSDNDND
jgi:hypothetical protein